MSATDAAKPRDGAPPTARVTLGAPLASPLAKGEFAALGALLALLCARLLVGFDPFPYWSTDPLFTPPVLLALGPGHMLALDGLTTVVAGVLLLLAARAGRTVPAWTFVPLALGALALIYHALVRHGTQLDDTRLGSPVLAGVASTLALAASAQHPRARALALGALVGVVAPLACKGAVQVLIEHPATVASFRATREQVFAANGWSSDSPMARAFERRLMQPEATGWFGLANVFASVAAGTLAAFATLALGAWRNSRALRREPATSADAPRAPLALLVVGVVLAGGALFLAGSKGGYAAAVLGIACGLLALLVLPRAPRLARCAPWLGVAAIVLPLLAVVARGLIGERLGELSILFRWFYAQGAARIIADNPLAGVGPDGFKQAYALAKPPISPEDVSSPHSILLDLFATLGLGGLALCVLVVALAWWAGRGLSADDRSGERDAGPTDGAHAHARTDLRAVFLIAAAGTILGSLIESAAGTPEAVLARFAGLVLWVLLGGAILRAADALSPRTLALAAAAGALAVLPHAQIELTGTHPQSAPWALALLGLGAAAGLAARAARQPARATGAAPNEPAPDVARQRPAGALLALTACALAAVPALIVTPRALRWQDALANAAAPLGDVAEFRARVQAARASGRTVISDRDPDLAPVFARLREAGLSPRSSLPALEGAIDAYAITMLARSKPALSVRAATLFPDHTPTLGALARAQLHLATAGATAAAPAAAGSATPSPALDALSAFRGFAHAAEAAAERAARSPRAGPGDWSFLATVRWHIADLIEGVARSNPGLTLDGDPAAARVRRLRLGAVDALRYAVRRDPTGVMPALTLARRAHQLGDRETAATTARLALDNDALKRLDPLAGLSDADRAFLRSIITPPVSSTPPTPANPPAPLPAPPS